MSDNDSHPPRPTLWRQDDAFATDELPNEHDPMDELPEDDLPSSPPAPSPDPRRDSSTLARLTGLLLFLTMLLVLRFVGPQIVEQITYATTRGRMRAQYEVASQHLPNAPLEALSMAYQMISQKVGPSVVHINVSGGRVEPNEDLRPEFRSRGMGSGILVDKEGYIVTNEHVVRGSRQILVSLSDGTETPAEIVGVDELTDLAVLKVRATGLIAAEWGDSDALNEGALVWAMGSPFGLERSITFGIVSAKHRSKKTGTPYQDYLQTDAAVNPGNSGGPLVDSSGRIVGINTAIVGDTFQGISFAIPSNVARDVYRQIRANGSVARGWLGVQLDQVTPASAKQLGLARPVGAQVISFVTDDNQVSPAAEAGLQPGDVIVRWNDQEVDSRDTLSRLIAQTAIGSTAAVRVLREGSHLDFQVPITERPWRYSRRN